MSKETDTLKELGETLCKALGFRPTSNSTKPLYIANGLFRESTGKTGELHDVHEWVVSERRAKATSSTDILEKYCDVFRDSKAEKPEVLQEVRFYLERIFNPDSTVYPSYDNSVMNISSKWLIHTYTHSEASIGGFLYQILNEAVEGKPSPALDMLRVALAKQDDDITRLIMPLVVRKTEKERITQTPLKPTSIALNSSKYRIRTGFDRLANNFKLLGQAEDSLLVLRRLVCFASFAVFFYLEDINCTEFTAPKIPLLLDAGLGLGAISSASSGCFLSCKKAVESFTINFLEKHLTGLDGKYITDINNKRAIEDYIDGFRLEGNKIDPVEVKSVILQHFNRYSEKGDTPIRAIARALQFALYTYTYPNNTPSDFCTVLGKRGGLVGPPGPAAKHIRFLIHRFALENLVLSSIETDQFSDGVELKELGNSLRRDYSILIGTDSDLDYSLLAEANIAQGTPENLRSELSLNAQGIADMLISLGLAKRYADGVTIIGAEV
jgi:hypothetical protein